MGTNRTLPVPLDLGECASPAWKHAGPQLALDPELLFLVEWALGLAEPQQLLV